MDITAMSALNTYAYQNAYAQTGNGSQALVQALTSNQSQMAQMGQILASASPIDPIASLAGSSGSQALVSLAYSTSASAGNGPGAVQSMLASLSGGTSALLPTSDSLPLSTAILSPSTTQALVRYAYDQSQNQTTTAAQAAASGQQALAASGWNLLV
jgi:hypothetical protein